MKLMKSWVTSANTSDCPFPLNNLPYGVFSINTGKPRLGIAIGDMILDVSLLADELPVDSVVLQDDRGWNGLMEQGSEVWTQFRNALINLLKEGAPKRPDALVSQSVATLHMPFKVTEFTDFYSAKHHATNVGTMFRGAENALPPNWLHMPIGYNGRASSVVISGTEIRRPWGQIKGPDDQVPRWAPSQHFDIELEMGAIVGAASNSPISVNQADANIFGYVLLNDWSARDIQAWEYQPLGPFQAKATATSISPWIVTTAALEPFRCTTPAREKELLPHLRDTGPMLYDIDLNVTLDGEVIAETNYNQLYYSAAQQLAHHSTSGCPMRSGDLIGSGTISGSDTRSRGSLLELSWGGKEPFSLKNGETRSFIEDGDILGLHGAAIADDYRIGFGDCLGKLLPAGEDPLS